MEWLWRGGAGFDCASAREVLAVQSITNEKKPNILFANPCKKKDDILSAAVQNIETTVVDSREELHKLSEIGWKGNSLLRLRVEDKGSTMPFSAKFGMELEEVEATAQAAAAGGQRLSGISFHVGSGCNDPEQYVEAVKEAAGALQTVKRWHPGANILDIGGGFTTGSKFVDAALGLQKLLPSLGGIRVVAEPGRFFAQTSHDLFVRVIGKKPAGKGKLGWRYTLDESLYGQFSCIPFDHAEPKWIRVRRADESPRRRTPATLYGRTCDSVDFIAAAASAEELEEGDWLWFPHMGAYTTVTSTEFNGFPKPPSLVLEAHRELQLPDPEEFSADAWPEGCKYVSAVQVPMS